MRRNRFRFNRTCSGEPRFKKNCLPDIAARRMQECTPSDLFPLAWKGAPIVSDLYADYSTDLTEEERELGFELLQIQPSSQRVDSIQAVGFRFSPSDQIVKLNIPVIGGSCYRHESLRSAPVPTETAWVPVGRVVFPTATMAVHSLVGEPVTHTCGRESVALA